ncbi:MAG TPA: alpha/beta hydrolase [Frankiaceae bacterium]|nr:alpha/beta hydrolase [Frankiaceae bacterium]
MTDDPGAAAPTFDALVPYGSHPQQDAEVTFPAASAFPAPLILLFHGGFWREQWNRDHLRPFAAALAEQGYAVANIEYRRVGGDGGWPSTLVDAATATDTLPGLIDALQPGRVDLSKVVTLGHSAGGHLSLWTALRSQIPQDSPGWVAAPPALAGAISLSGAIDLTEAFRLNEGNGAVTQFLNGGPDEVPDRYAAADPALIGIPHAPVVLIHGEKDDVLHVAMSRDYASRYGATMVELEGGSHMDMVDHESAAWPLLLNALHEMCSG